MLVQAGAVCEIYKHHVRQIAAEDFAIYMILADFWFASKTARRYGLHRRAACVLEVQDHEVAFLHRGATTYLDICVCHTAWQGDLFAP